MKTLIRIIIVSAALIITTSCDDKGDLQSSIRMNQVGFYPNQEKTMTLESKNPTETIRICRKGSDDTIWEGGPIRSAVSPWSGKERRIFDFSEITEPGTAGHCRSKEIQI